MAEEIERKFLINGDAWRSLARPVHMRQGYLADEPGRAVRVRVAGDRAWLTVKGPTHGASRCEYEYEIPVADAVEMLVTLCSHAILEKRRSRISQDGLVWEVDEFLGENAGLIVAEVELGSESQAVTMPDWIGAEVTGDPRYYNSNLVKNPYSRWRQTV